MPSILNHTFFCSLPDFKSRPEWDHFSFKPSSLHHRLHHTTPAQHTPAMANDPEEDRTALINWVGRTGKWTYRLGYLAFNIMAITMVMTVRRTKLWNRDGTHSPERMAEFWLCIVMQLVAYFVLQGTDGGAWSLRKEVTCDRG